MKKRVKLFETLKRLERQRLDPLRIEYKKREEEQSRRMKAIKTALQEIENAYANLDDENRWGLSQFLNAQKQKISLNEQIISTLEVEQELLREKIREHYRVEQMYQHLGDRLVSLMKEEELKQEQGELDALAIQGFISKKQTL